MYSDTIGQQTISVAWKKDQRRPNPRDGDEDEATSTTIKTLINVPDACTVMAPIVFVRCSTDIYFPVSKYHGVEIEISKQLIMVMRT